MVSETSRLLEILAYLRWLLLPVLVAVSWFVPRLGDRWFSAIEGIATRAASKKTGVVLGISLSAIASRLILLWIMPMPVPSIHDDFSLLLAADTFCHGRLTNPPHPMAVFLDTFHIIQYPTYSSIYPPAQEAALALGQILGHPWVGVLLSMSVMCAAITWMLQRWLPARWALLGGILVLVRLHLFSYWLEGYWGGAVAAVGAALVLGAFPRIVTNLRSRDVVLMSIGAALLANSRPVEGLIFCIPIGLALIYWLSTRPRAHFWMNFRTILVPFAAVMVPTFIFMGYYNWRVTGDVLLFPHSLYLHQYTNYSVFVWQKPPAPIHYPNPEFEQYFNGWVRETFHPSWHLVWEKLSGWWNFFLGSFLAIPLLSMPWVLRDRRTRLPLIVFACCAIGLLAVLYFEAHYAAPMTAAFLILLVQAMRHLRRWEIGGRPVGIFLTRLVVVLAMLRVGVLGVEVYRHPPQNWGLARARVARQLDAAPGKQLVIVRYAPNHFIHDEWVYNGADIDGSKVVWAREIPGKDMTPILSYFHDRKVWIAEPDQVPPRLEPYPSESPEQSAPAEGHP